ncbi:MAG: membrane protein insertase YidC [Candidatus Krumholzibacteria bacterium]|nr:membrane protein insertase YidC [Candidatus Krumholzibacteria bacterium]
MERRALVAFLASIALFFAYDALFLSPKLKKERARRAELAEQQHAVVDSVTAAGGEVERQPALVPYDATAADTTASKPLEFEAAATNARAIVVASDLYEITLSTAGAEIVSARLLNYKTDGVPVELFAQDPDWRYERVLAVALQSDAGAMRLNGVAFDATVGGVGDALLDGARVEVDQRRGYTDVVFRAQTEGGGGVERAYRFYSDRYDFETTLRFPLAVYPGVTGVTWGLGPGMTATEKNVKDDQQAFKASLRLGEEQHRLRPSSFGRNSSEAFSGTLHWAALQTKYFMTAVIPGEPTPAEVEVSGDKAGHRVSQRFTLPAGVRGGRVEQMVRVYIGPMDARLVKDLGVGLEANIEMGWKLFRPIAWGVLWAMLWTYKVIPNYGWVIIIISVLAKVLFYRLTHKSFKSMKDMQALQPRIQALREKHGKDKQKLSEETMKLYRSAGVNPLGGCLPMLLQMPVFIALYNVLRFTIEVRGAHFVGWINDLSQQDQLFQLPMSLPFIGDAFSLLPILMGLSMFLQSKLGGSPTGSTSPTPPGFSTMLPIVFTVLFYKMPSGLVLYWLVNTVLSVAQQYYINKDTRKSKETAEAEPAPARPAKRRAKAKGR